MGIMKFAWALQIGGVLTDGKGAYAGEEGHSGVREEQDLGRRRDHSISAE